MVRVLTHQVAGLLVCRPNAQLQPALRRNIHLRPDVSHFGDQRDERFHPASRSTVVARRVALRPRRQHYRFAFVWQLLPNLFGDVRHQRMQQPQARFEHIDDAAASRRHLVVDFSRRDQRLGQLDVPVAEGVPEKVIHRLRCFVEPVFVQSAGHLLDRRVQFSKYPPIGKRVRRNPSRLDVRRVADVHQNESRRVPDLVGEVSSLLDLRLALLLDLREADVLASSRAHKQRESQRVGPVELYHVKRIDAGSERFLLRPALFVKHRRVDVHIVERDLAHEMQSRHDHSRHPQVDDVTRSRQH